ncbi:transporter [Niveibacterium sp. SC-1]|uniref:SphA family protein n=1 Tax=Niveibacterium sp. SC-1 TaxID=3135646 RepID=UPI00311D4AE3
MSASNFQCLVRIAAVGALAMANVSVRADEGGVSFWLPGQFGSLAAVPGAPGWSLGAVYYHTSAEEDADKQTHRGGRVVDGVDADADLLFVSPSYTFATPLWGGQAALGGIVAFGNMKVNINASYSGPRGTRVSGGESDSRSGVSDLYGLGTVKWNQGVHNTMVYTMVGAPVGTYDVDRLANLGTNHWSIDTGGGYTYLNPKDRMEFSVVAGMTYSFENPDTHYQNGIDAHLDWGASYFFDAASHVGLAGYFYGQLSGDSGDGATLGDFKSQVIGVGPQIGHFFAFNGGKGYVSLKGYGEFAAEHRPAGWNVWLSALLPL